MSSRNEFFKIWMIKNKKKWCFILNWITTNQIPKILSAKSFVKFNKKIIKNLY